MNFSCLGIVVLGWGYVIFGYVIRVRIGDFFWVFDLYVDLNRDFCLIFEFIIGFGGIWYFFMWMNLIIYFIFIIL